MEMIVGWYTFSCRRSAPNPHHSPPRIPLLLPRHRPLQGHEAHRRRLRPHLRSSLTLVYEEVQLAPSTVVQ
jgi:hypothetical protein